MALFSSIEFLVFETPSETRVAVRERERANSVVSYAAKGFTLSLSYNYNHSFCSTLRATYTSIREKLSGLNSVVFGIAEKKSFPRRRKTNASQAFLVIAVEVK